MEAAKADTVSAELSDHMLLRCMTNPYDAERAHLSPAAQGPPGFERIYVLHFELVRRALRHMAVPEVDASDAAQAVFLVVFKGLEKFQGRSRLETWLYGICRHVAANYRRALSRRREVLVEPEALDVEAAGSLEAAEAHAKLARVRAILSRMPRRQSQVLLLFNVEQLRGPEIARRLGITDSAVRYRLRRARQQLSRELRRLPLDPVV